MNSSVLYAQSEGESGGSGFQSLIGIFLMIVIFFVFFIWPQSRKQKKQQEFINSLEKGDEVVTQSGLYGKIHGLTDRVVTLEIAPNTRVRMDRQSIVGKQADHEAKAS